MWVSGSDYCCALIEHSCPKISHITNFQDRINDIVLSPKGDKTLIIILFHHVTSLVLSPKGDKTIIYVSISTL